MNQTALPSLREELALFPGPRLVDGQPSWTIQDPVRNQFFRLDWLTFEIVSNWQRGDPESVAEAVRESTPFDVSADDVEGVFKFLMENQLLRPEGPKGLASLVRIAHARRESWWLWLIHNYLFFRVPLVRPDRWLSMALHPARWLFSRTFLFLTLAALVAGVLLISRQWEVFSATLVDTFTPTGFACYALALIFAKILHELAHGLAARRHGCHVPAMGIAFLVMWPMPYTDVNEAWKLPDRRARLMISAAGVLAELALAVWATLAWGLLEDGLIRTAVFLLATTTWVITILVNLSPFMRFDGYFVLSDLLDVPNLHARSFALARWKLREWLFALGDAPPEYMPGRAPWLILFAFFTWIYRLVVFIGIAVLVYAFFVKFLGILLFLVEVIWFILRPMYFELKVWRSRWSDIRRSRRTLGSLAIGCLMAALVLTPLPWRMQVSGMLYPGDEHAVYAPEGARVEAIYVKDGQHIAKGAPLFALSSGFLDERTVAARSRIARLSSQADSASVSPDLRSRLLVLQADLQTARASLRSVEVQMLERRPLAQQSGRVRLHDPDLRAGVWVARNEKLATIVDGERWHAVAYLAEQDVHRIAKGARARFYFEAPIHAPIEMSVSAIDLDATRVLLEGALALSSGGSVAGREIEGKFIPERAVYRLKLDTERQDSTLAAQTWRGKVVLFGESQSLAGRAARAAMAVLWKEAGW